MHFSCQALALAALALETATALPGLHHRHHHASKRDLFDVLHKRVDYNNVALYKGVDWKEALKNVDWAKQFGGSGGDGSPAPAENPAPASNPAPPSKPNPAPKESPAPSKPQTDTVKTSPSSGGSGSCVDISQVWSKGDTSKSGPTAAEAGQGWTDKATSSASKAKRQDPNLDVDYIGNTGGGQYGSNIVPLSDCNDQSHMYTIKFTNEWPDKHDMAVMIWNKAGFDGQANSGMGYNSYFMVDLPFGKSASFAFEPNTQIAFAESSDVCSRQGGLPGAWNCLWGEANFMPEGPNMGTNSWDVSGMINNADPNSVPGALSLSDGSPGGTSSKANCGFFSAAQLYGGEGSGAVCDPNIPKGQPVHLTATFGVNN